MAHFIAGALHFVRARAMQAPITFVGVTAAVTYYGVYDISYRVGSLVVFNPTKQSAMCKYGGHAAGLAIGAAALSFRFPRAAIAKAITAGQIMEAPWMEATATVGSSALVSGLTSAGVQRACSLRNSAD
mmetsp:Transcript_23103/g.59356  ORF Transcript_23103/g.59356 Transcript_23103/m.59356 type:complete len:129 (-) Transcript_23103:131-517(-)